MTRVMPTIPVATALKEALKRLNYPCWVGNNDEQQTLVRLLDSYETALGGYEQWCDAITADTAAEINTWLADNGFDFTLDEWEDDGTSFGVAGATDVQVNWVETGTVSSILAGGDTYPAFEMGVKAGVVSVLQTHAGEYVVELHTTEGMIVRIKVDDDPGSSVALAEAALGLHAESLSSVTSGWVEEVRIPMVLLDVMADLDALLGLRAPKPGAPTARIAQAAGQTMFSMNQNGAHAKEAAAAQVVIESFRMPYEVDSPFLLTIGFPGIPPLFGAYITQEHWVDPANSNE